MAVNKVKVDKSFMTSKAKQIKSLAEKDKAVLDKISKLVDTLQSAEGWEGDSHGKFVKSFNGNKKKLLSFENAAENFANIMTAIATEVDSKDAELKTRISKLK